MSKYIDRDALLERLDGIWDCNDITFPNGRDHICKVPEDCKGCKWHDVLAAFKEMVKNAPAVNVEPSRTMPTPAEDESAKAPRCFYGDDYFCPGMSAADDDEPIEACKKCWYCSQAYHRAEAKEEENGTAQA